MKKIIIWIFAVLVVGFIVTAFIVSSNKSTLKSGEKNFAFTDTASITKIFLADKKNHSVLLIKQDSGMWLLNDKYYAQPEMINELLKTIMYITVRRPVSNAEHNNVIKRMSSHSTKVEIYAKVYTIDFLGIKLWPREKLVRTYYVGDNTQDNLGTYMLMEDADNAFVVHIPGFRGFVHTRYSPMLSDWRDHGVFRYSIPQISSITINYPEYPERSIVLKNPDNENYEVSNPILGTITNLDTIRTINFMNAFTDVRYEMLLTDLSDHTRDSILKLPEFCTIEIKDRNNKIKSIKLIRIGVPEGTTNLLGDTIKYDQERLYGILPNNEIVIAQYFVFGPLMRDYLYFVKDNNLQEAKPQEFQTIF